MKAIETTGQIDKEGGLHLSKPLLEKNKKVKVIVLVPDDEVEEDELLWMNSITKNPSFGFLKDPAEDIYTLKDGKPLHD